MKRLMFLICGICWLGFGSGFGLFLLHYVTNGAGLQDLGPQRWMIGHAISSGSVSLGFVHAAGLFMLSALCFLIGIGLCSSGLASSRENGRNQS